MRIAALLLVVTTIFGQPVNDPYRWLEDASNARTQAWIAQQNARAESAIDAYPGNKRIAARIAALSLTGEQRFDPQLRGSTLFYMREIPPQPQAVLVAQAWPSGQAQTVADPSWYGDNVSIDFVWPSPSGKLVAMATSSGGSEAATIRVAAVNGEPYAEALGPAGGGTTSPAVAWDADERGFTYGRLPSNGSQFGIQLYHHVLGKKQKDDTLALAAVSPVAEFELVTSQGGSDAAALAHFGDGSPDRVYLRRANRWEPVVGPDAGIIGGTYAGDRLLVVATAGTPHGRVAVVRDSGVLRTLVSESRGWAYHAVAPIQDGFLVTKSWGMDWRVDQYTDDGRFVRTVGLPRRGISIGAIASSGSDRSALIAYSGWTIPARWASYDTSTGTLTQEYAMRASSDEYRNVVVRSIVATSADGAHVPVTVLALRKTPVDGKAPVILTGYGGFGISTTPRFLGATLAWLELGGMYAEANLRGGGEFGESWHQQGMLTNKQHVFDDFYAAARALVSNGFTTPEKLGIEGGSNGGLLVGAALVQHPQQYGAVAGAAGLYDMVRYANFPNGTYNVPEYGSIRDPRQFGALYRYSPYHNVRTGVAYPPVLLITSENDPRVASWQSWKFGAALQAATSSKRPILVLTRQTGGHGHGASFAQRVGNATVTYSFLAQQLGIR